MDSEEFRAHFEEMLCVVLGPDFPLPLRVVLVCSTPGWSHIVCTTHGPSLSSPFSDSSMMSSFGHQRANNSSSHLIIVFVSLSCQIWLTGLSPSVRAYPINQEAVRSVYPGGPSKDFRYSLLLLFLPPLDHHDTIRSSRIPESSSSTPSTQVSPAS